MLFIYSNKDKDNAIKYIQNKSIPINIQSIRDIDNFKKKWEGITFTKSKFMKNTKEIIFKEDIQQFLNIIYNNPQYGYVRRDKMFSKLKKQYINISVRDVNKFLQNLETNQIHIAKKSVVASRPT